MSFLGKVQKVESVVLNSIPVIFFYRTRIFSPFGEVNCIFLPQK